MKTRIGYKLFEKDSKGNLYPLFIDKKNAIPVGVWVKAENHPTPGFSNRPGYHIGEMPDAPWLKAEDGTYKSQRGKTFKRVWCKVEYNATNDYNEEVSKLKKKCFDSRCPENGFYFFAECGKGVWSITSDIKVLGEMNEKERREVLKEMNHDEEEAFKPYKEAFEKKRHNLMIKKIRS